MSTATLHEQNMLSIAEKDPDEGLVTQAEYARMRDVSKMAITRHIQNGNLTLINGKIDPELADQQLEEALSEELGSGKREINSNSSYSQANTRHKKAQAALVELNLQEKYKELVKAKEVKTIAFNTARKFRDRMLGIPDRVSALIAAERDKNKVHRILMDEIEKGIKEI